jgi:hypothetical protein
MIFRKANLFLKIMFEYTQFRNSKIDAEHLNICSIPDNLVSKVQSTVILNSLILRYSVPLGLIPLSATNIKVLCTYFNILIKSHPKTVVQFLINSKSKFLIKLNRSMIHFQNF